MAHDWRRGEVVVEQPGERRAEDERRGDRAEGTLEEEGRREQRAEDERTRAR